MIQGVTIKNLKNIDLVTRPKNWVGARLIHLKRRWKKPLHGIHQIHGGGNLYLTLGNCEVFKEKNRTRYQVLLESIPEMHIKIRLGD